MPKSPVPVLTLRVVDLLDRSREGMAGAHLLQERLAAAHRQRLALPEAETRQRFEEDAARAIEGERVRLRERLLTRIRAIAEDLREERGASAVLDDGLCLARAPDVDVTEEVLARLDAPAMQRRAVGDG